MSERRSRANPNAWARCSSCGGRRRAGGTSTECNMCRRAKQKYASTGRVGINSGHPGASAYRLAYARTVEAGHRMGRIETDEGLACFISRCEACLGFLVGDPDAQDEDGTFTPLYGRAYRTVCPGAPPVPPALRRDPMQEAAVTSRASEPVPADLSGLWLLTDKGWAWDTDDYLPIPGWESLGAK